MSTVLLAVVLGTVGAFVSYLSGVRKATSQYDAAAAARTAAQAGLDKAIWCLNQSSGTDCDGTYGSGFAGETGVAVGTGSYTTSVTDVSGNAKTLTSVGTYPATGTALATATLKVDATTDTSTASFFYGVQAGNGGFTMSNNAYVEGNIYANGNVVGASGAYVTGDVHVAGGTALSPDQEQQTNSQDYVYGQSSPTLDIGQSFQLSDDANVNKISLYIRKVGSPSNSTIRIVTDNAGKPSKTVIGTATLTAASVTGSFAWVDVSFTTPPALADGVTYWWVADTSANASNYWVIGSLTNNGYGNGIGMVSANWNASTPVWSDAGRDYAFRIWTGGVTTKIEDTHIYGDAHANTINDSDIDGDAYYQTISGTSVGGTSYPGSADPGPQDMPISDALLAQWKTEAEAGGTITGDVTYTNGASQSLGPKKITGNLTVDNNSTLTLTGTIYVQGTITFSNNVIVRLDPSYGANSGIIIADGKINVNNNVIFEGSGTAGSYLLVLTTNPSLDSGSPAMALSNNSDNSIFYASDGVISINNNASLKEVTAFRINLENNASVEYESGLANVNFSSGPGGSWVVKGGTLREIR